MVRHPKLISFVLRAPNRKKVLSLLSDKSMYPGQLTKATGMYKSHVTRTLKELEGKGFIKCRNPMDRSYKFYTLTALGKKVLAEVKKLI